jgi:hypothetical protein
MLLSKCLKQALPLTRFVETFFFIVDKIDVEEI